MDYIKSVEPTPLENEIREVMFQVALNEGATYREPGWVGLAVSFARVMEQVRSWNVIKGWNATPQDIEDAVIRIGSGGGAIGASSTDYGSSILIVRHLNFRGYIQKHYPDYPSIYKAVIQKIMEDGRGDSPSLAQQFGQPIGMINYFLQRLGLSEAIRFQVSGTRTIITGLDHKKLKEILAKI